MKSPSKGNLGAQVDLAKLIIDITEEHYRTDYTSCDYMYPPQFIWNKYRPEEAKNLVGDLATNLSDVYVHFPYCRQRCTFCRQFSIKETKSEKIKSFTDALLREIEIWASILPKQRIENIYFGGGTPTLFSMAEVMNQLQKHFEILPGQQLNVESTFEELTDQKISELHQIGANRLLLGIQSFDPVVLHKIGRPQSYEAFLRVYEKIRKTDVSICLELVAGLPEQTHDSFLLDVERVISAQPDSIHIYSFIPSRLTTLGRRKPKMFEVSEMYFEGIELLAKHGYEPRGDDFARSDSARNQYLAELNPAPRNKLAMGPSAFGVMNHGDTSHRFINTLDVDRYVEVLKRGELPIEKSVFLDSEDTMMAEIFRTLRYGKIDTKAFEKKFGFKFQEHFSEAIQFLERIGAGHFSKDEFECRAYCTWARALYPKRVLEECRRHLPQKNSQKNALTTEGSGVRASGT